jgi:hypothetical protein
MRGNIEMHLKEIEYEFGDLILVAQDRDYWRAIVNVTKIFFEGLEIS